MRTIAKTARLSQEKETELAIQYITHDDLDAVQKLIVPHLPFVVHMARKYSGYGLPQADLIQEGNIGLIKAAKKFDPSSKVRLVSFAVHWIRAEMLEYILRNWKIVKIATTKSQRKLFFNIRSQQKKLENFSKDEIKKIANKFEVSESEVAEMEGRMRTGFSSYDTTFTGENDELSSEIYLSNDGDDVAEIVERERTSIDIQYKLSKALEELTDRERDILTSRWLTENKSTLKELAFKYEVSIERIRQIESNAKRKAKELITYH